MTEHRDGFYAYATFGYSDPDKEDRIKKKLKESLDSLIYQKGKNHHDTKNS